jgi:hypothetical protein
MSGTRSAAKKSDETLDVDSSQNDDPTAVSGAMAPPKSAAAAGTPTAKSGKAVKKTKFPCGKCDAEVNCGVLCNACDIWYHDKCVEGMTKEYFDNCKKSAEIQGYTGFLCKVCRKVFTTVMKALKEVKGELNAMENRVMILEQEKEVLAQKLERIEKGAEKVTERVEGVAKEVASGMEKAKEEVKKEVKSELATREEKSSNICIYGLEESKEDDAAKWREAETKKVMDMVEQIGVRVEGEVVVKFRAGRQREEGAKPRPLIVRVADDEMRARIFRNARLLSREERTRRVFISQDLTPQQREEDRKAELERKEEAARKTEEAKNAGRKEKFVVVGMRGRRRVVRRMEEEVEEVE